MVTSCLHAANDINNVSLSVSIDSAQTAGDWEDILSDTVVYYLPLSLSLPPQFMQLTEYSCCLLYTSDAADE